MTNHDLAVVAIPPSARKTVPADEIGLRITRSGDPRPG